MKSLKQLFCYEEMRMFPFHLSKRRCIRFNADRYKSSKTMKVETNKVGELRDYSPLSRLRKVEILFLNEAEKKECAGHYVLSLDEQKDLTHFTAMTLDLLQVDVPR